MRTTVTIDADTEHLIQEEIRRTGRSFKAILNDSVRRDLSSQRPSAPPTPVEPLFTAPFPREFEGRSFNHLADELDDLETIRELGR